MPLTPDEVEELGRIHVLAQFGSLPDTMKARFRELRDRDDHLDIAEPTLDVQWMPAQRRRDDAIDDLIDLYDDEAETVAETAAETKATADVPVDDMADFELAFSLNSLDDYVVSPGVSTGFVPSAHFRGR